MSFPDYGFTPHVDGVDEIIAAEDINELQAAIQEIATIVDGIGGGSGGRGDYDYIIVDGATYIAYSPTGGEISNNASLATVWGDIAGSGVHIHFDEGTFSTSSTLSLSSGMRVTGAGLTRTHITKTGSGSLFSGVGVDGGTQISDVEVAYLHLAGPSVSGTQVSGSGVFFDFYDHVEVHHCEINGFGSLGDDAGVEVDTGVDAHIHHNRLHDNKNGVCTGSPTSTTIRSQRGSIVANMCYDNYDDGIHGQRSQYMTITGNYTWGHPNGGAADGSGIDVLGDEFDVITGNVSFDNTRGIEVGNSANTSYPDKGHTIAHNICWGNTYGIALIARQERITVSDNVLEGNTDGVRIGTGTAGQSLNDIDVTHNQISNNSNYGIDLFGDVDRATIMLNILRSNTTADIKVRTSGGNNPATYALIDNRTMSTTGIDDTINAGDKVLRTFGA